MRPADTVVRASACLHGLGVVQGIEVLAADAYLAVLEGVGKERHVVRTAFQVHHAILIGCPGIAIDHGIIAVYENLHVGGIAEGENAVHLLLAVVAKVLHLLDARAVAVLIDGVDVYGGFADDGAFLAREAKIEGVIALIESRADPVEVDKFAVLVPSEYKTCGEHGALEVRVERHARMQTCLVEPQLVLPAHQHHVHQVVVLGHIEALEGRVAKRQLVGDRTKESPLL